MVAQGLTVTPHVLVLGGTLTLEVEPTNTGTRPHTVVLDHVVHHVRANGTRVPKVFKWTRLELTADQRGTPCASSPVRPSSTRTYHPGEHLVEAQVNGVTKASAGFELRL